MSRSFEKVVICMQLTDIYNAKGVAVQQSAAENTRSLYLGEGLFPAKKKTGLDLKWIRARKGLPVSLAPSNFDAKSVLRSRAGIQMDESEMAFFRESMLVKEEDEQAILRVQEAGDPYALEVLARIYDDAATLIDSARVVPERMRMQLLAPVDDGSPRINIEANGVLYSYDYDVDGSYQTNNYKALTGTAMWSDADNSDPLADVLAAQDAVEARTGSRPAAMILSKKTMGYLRKNKKIREYILMSSGLAVAAVNEARVLDVFRDELDIDILVYNRKFIDESGMARQFFPDDIVTLLPEGSLGNTWYGVTPEERSLWGSQDANVALVDTGIAVSVSVSNDPVNTKTTVSEIVLPSFERMDETFVIKVSDGLPVQPVQPDQEDQEDQEKKDGEDGEDGGEGGGEDENN